MESWFNVVTPRTELVAGRSFSPDEFAVALEQVVAGTAPQDYCQPEQFFDRTCFTAGLVEQSGLVLRRLAGQTQNTAPVMSLVSGFGGGKTHTLTTLLHLVRSGRDVESLPCIGELLAATGVERIPEAATGVFVGNAWDPVAGRETPWIDLARQIAGDDGVRALGSTAISSPPGTDALGRMLQAAGRPVLILCDEVINFTARHESLAEGFLAFLHNLTVTLTGTACGALVVSLPQHDVEMTSRDRGWHERVLKVVRRVARDLVGSGEGDVAEILRRRLFEDLGPLETRRQVAGSYAEWCVANRDRLPVEWSGEDGAPGNEPLFERLRDRFLACYPFHPATVSVFQRKWSGLPQYQQTRGMLAVLARWVTEGHARLGAHAESPEQPLISLGSAPLHDAEFRRLAFGQLGIAGLDAAVDADVVHVPDGEGRTAGVRTHAETLDADTQGSLAAIHQRVATAICFESAGGHEGRIARLPELRLSLGEPQLDTATVDSVAAAVESQGHFIHRSGRDGFRMSSRPKIDRAVREREASLDDRQDIRPVVLPLISSAFEPASVALTVFPQTSADVPDVPRLTLVVVDIDDPWTGDEEQRQRVQEWIRQRGASSRLYPGGLLFCFPSPGTALRDSVAASLSWRAVSEDLQSGLIGDQFEPESLDAVPAKLSAAESRLGEEVCAAYQTIVLADRSAVGGLRVSVISPSSNGSSSLAELALKSLRDEAVVSDTISSGYIKRAWPPAFRDSGVWPLASLRQSFFDGSLVRLADADHALRSCVCAGVLAGEFGFGVGVNGDGSFDHVWFQEEMDAADVVFDAHHALLSSVTAASLDDGVLQGDSRRQSATCGSTDAQRVADKTYQSVSDPETSAESSPLSGGPILVEGLIPPEQWNRIGTRVVAKLKSAGSVTVNVSITAECDGDSGADVVEELRRTLDEMGLGDAVTVRRDS